MVAWREQHYHISIDVVVSVVSTLLRGGSMLIVAEDTLFASFASDVRLTRGSYQPSKMAVAPEDS